MFRVSARYGVLTVGRSLAALAVLLSAASADANHAFRVLYTFCPTRHCSDGYFPESRLIADAAGNLYGTARSGGMHNGGVVFKVAPDGTESVVHAFTGGMDGKHPFSGLTADRAGNLYGTTMTGGNPVECRHPNGCGTVFELSPDAAENGFAETVLYAFKGGRNDGNHPGFSELISDAQGNLYGTTLLGGNRACRDGCGTIFKIAPDGTDTLLHALDGRDGERPQAGLIADRQGNLYGTARDGSPKGCGTVFKLATDGTMTVLHHFSCGKDGGVPSGTLIADANGNLLGTTEIGGKCNFPNNCGVVFRIAPDGAETVLHTFTGRRDGAFPGAGLIADMSGNLYGTAGGGGDDRSCFEGCGVVFKLAPDGTETVLHAFHGSDGENPEGALFADAHGNLYGTTEWGGYLDKCFNGGCGTVFEVQK